METVKIKQSMEQPQWPKKAKQHIKTDGKVDLSGEHIEDLSLLPSSKLTRQLNLSYVQIPNLDKLKPQPNLNSFIADGSTIGSLLNFRAIQTIKTLSMKNTPVSLHPNFIISLLLVCPNVSVINGKLISKQQISRASKYPKVCSELVNMGWMATYPPPDVLELDTLCKDYNLNSQSEDNNHNQNVEEEKEEYIDHFELDLQKFYLAHDRMIEDARRVCGLIPMGEEEEFQFEEEEALLENHSFVEEEEIQEDLTSNQEEEEVWDIEEGSVELPLIQRISTILMENGIEIDQNNIEESVLAAIDSLCLENEETLSNA